MEHCLVKLSAKRITVTHQPYAWCIGIYKEFLANHPNLPQRISLFQRDGKVIIQFGENGNKFSVNKGSIDWTTLSQIWMKDIHPPIASLHSMELEGIFNPETIQIELDSSHYPPTLKSALQSEPMQIPKRDLTELEKHDTFKIKPRFNKLPLRPPPPLQNLKTAETKVEAERNSLMPYCLPTTVVHWTPENIKALKTLIMDLQANRPDIVFQVVNGIVTMRRQLFEDV